MGAGSCAVLPRLRCLLPVLLVGTCRLAWQRRDLHYCNGWKWCAPPCLCAGTEMIPANEKYGLEPIASEVRLRLRVV